MSELKITVEIPGLEELVAEMRRNNELVAKTMVSNDMTAATSKSQPVPEAESETETEAATSKSQPVPEASNDESENKVAGRRTYVFFKDSKTGTIVEKGEEVPTENGAVGVSKTKWEKLFEKYDLDPSTGKKNEAEPEADDDDDLDLPGDDDSANDDDDLGLGGDDNSGEVIDKNAVHQKLIDYMKQSGREPVLKLFKKYGATNFDNLPEENFADIYRDVKKWLSA
jgi:hypothetical protein